MLLVDTNVWSELRRVGRRHPRADPGVAAWYRDVARGELYTSVLVVGEMHRGAERVRHRGDALGADALQQWVHRLELTLGSRVLPVTMAIARRWGGLGVPDPISLVDGVLAATALEHGLTVVTRNTKDFSATGVATRNPFSR